MAQGVTSKRTLLVWKRFARRITITGVLDILRLFAITVVWIVVAILLAYYAYMGSIQRTLAAIDVTHVEMFGVKLEVNREQSDLIRNLETENSSNSENYNTTKYVIDPDGVELAIKRGKANSGAVRGARILWVDDHPENNSTFISILSTLGISVVAATDNELALRLLTEASRGDGAFDLIVTDGHRDIDDGDRGRHPLRQCPLRYANVPAKVAVANVATLNTRVAQGLNVLGGYQLAEAVAELHRSTSGDALAEDAFTDYAAPRILMYSGSNGEIAYNPCFRSITRRADRLLNGILNILEERRVSSMVWRAQDEAKRLAAEKP